MVISQPIILALIICCFGYCQTLNILPPIIAHSMSKRLLNTENPHIEDVCDKYADIPDLIMLALGSVYWNPPQEALQEVVPELTKPATHRYGSILGEPSLRDHLMQLLSQPPCMMDMSNLDVIVTAGANQGFMNVALAVLDEGDDVIILAPYYFCHKVACQLCDAKIHISPLNKDTLGPDWATLETMVASIRPKMIVITSPNNPSGYVWSSSELQRVVQLSKSVDAWLAVDQTYHEFLFDGAQHTYPCSTKHNYNKIMQLFSFSKLFAMPGYRVGYLVYPKELASHMRKIQDCVPTHASIFSQALALKCLQLYYPIHDAATPPPPPPPTTTTTTTTTTITSHSQQKQPDRLCFPSAWDAAAAESRILTENCTYAFYTVAVGGRFGKMHPLRKFRDTPPQCRVAFVDRRSTTLAKKGKSDQISIVTSSHSSTSTSNSNRSSSITSSTSYQVVSGWTIIYVSDYFPFTLSTSSRRASRVPKFCPGRFFADSVHYAFYIDNKIRIKRDVTELLRFLEPTERNGYKQSAMLMIHNRLFHTYRQEVQTLFKLRNKGRTGITLEPEMLQAQMLAYDELLQRYPGMRLHKTFDAGFIIHNLRHEFARRFRCTWFREYFDWSDRDQISSIRVIQLMGNYSMGSAHVGCHNYIPLGCASSVSDEDGKMVVRSNTSDTDHGKGEGCSHLCMLPPNFHWWSKSVKAIGDWLRLADIKSN